MDKWIGDVGVKPNVTRGRVPCAVISQFIEVVHEVLFETGWDVLSVCIVIAIAIIAVVINVLMFDFCGHVHTIEAD